MVLTTPAPTCPAHLNGGPLQCQERRPHTTHRYEASGASQLNDTEPGGH